MTESNTPTQSELAGLFKAAGDNLRLDILALLSRGSYGVLELVEVFDVKQSGMSHHLKVLANAGLVSTRREGNSIFYRSAVLNPIDPLYNAKQAIQLSLVNLNLDKEAQTRLDNIHTSRSKVSSDFFSENAGKFREQQELIAAFSVYEPSVKDLLKQTPLPSRNAVLEIGPGEGELLPLLDQEFDQVVAIDNSQAMLEKAESLVKEKDLNKVELVHSDTEALNDYPEHFDCALMNMVLHHTPAPQQIFIDVSHSIKADGAILVTDLCNHEQEWAREACGDLWMGFEPEELNRWAAEAGFSPGQSSYLALRNGFQIQFQQYFKR